MIICEVLCRPKDQRKESQQKEKSLPTQKHMVYEL